MARSHTTAGFPAFSRYGSDVLVVWDDEDPAADPCLQASLMVALALATRKHTAGESGDLQALARIEQRIGRELERLGKIRDAAASIRKQVGVIDTEVATGTAKLERLVAGGVEGSLAVDEPQQLVEIADRVARHLGRRPVRACAARRP